MGTPLSPAAQARHRDSIRTSMLIQRVEMCVLSEKDPQTGKPVKMTAVQMSGALGLLRKTLPDLTASELTAPPGTAGGFVIFGETKAKSTEDWAAANPPPA